MVELVVIQAETISCTLPHQELLQVFNDRKITMIQVANIPSGLQWPEACAHLPGMIEIQKFRNYSWHQLETPEQACQFMVDTDGKIFQGNQLIAEGLYSRNLGFHEILAGIREQLVKKGFPLREATAVPRFDVKKKRR